MCVLERSLQCNVRMGGGERRDEMTQGTKKRESPRTHSETLAWLLSCLQEQMEVFSLCVFPFGTGKFHCLNQPKLTPEGIVLLVDRRKMKYSKRGRTV